MNEEKSRTTQFMEGVALLVGIVIAASALAISAYRQYILVLRTLPQNSDLLVQALPFLAPFCVEGFIIYTFIRLRYTRPKVGELVALGVYGLLMVVSAIVSNIIESNISMGIALTDQSLATFMQTVVPAIPVATGLVMLAMHLLAVRDTAAGVKADNDEQYDREYQKELGTALAARRKVAAKSQAAADAQRMIASLAPEASDAPSQTTTPSLPAPNKQTNIGESLRALVPNLNGNHKEPEAPNSSGQRQP